MKQKIYIMSRNRDNVIEPDISIVKDLITQGLTCNVKDIWQTVKLEWYDDIDTPKYDFLFIYGYIPICNEKVYKFLINHNSLAESYFLPIIVDNDKYYIISGLPMERYVLNKRKSKIKYYSDKSVMKIEKIVLNEFTPKSCLFKIPESITTFFATDEFVGCVKVNNFTGVTFDECKLVTPSFLSKLF